MAEYTGEVVGADGGGQAKPYTGEVIRTPASLASASPQAAGGDSTLGFISGNLSKGVAGIAGLPVDTARNLTNLGIAAFGRGTGRGGDAPEPIQPGPGSSQWFEGLMRRGGMISPSAEPQSGVGQYGAAMLQGVPAALMGRFPTAQIPRRLMAAGTSGAAAQGASDVLGPEYAGPAAMVAGGRGMLEKSPGERATAGRQAERFETARGMGIPVPPRAMKPDRPQQKIQNAANRDLRQPEGTEFNAEMLKRYTAAQYAEGYEPLAKGMPSLVPNKSFQDTIKKMRAEEEPPKELRKTFKGNKEVLDLLSDYQQGTTMEPKVALRAIKKLRDDATTNFSSDKPEKIALAKTQKGIANAIEQLIDDNLAKSGNQELLGKYRSARTMIAKAHDYMDALQPGSRISPEQIAQAETKGSPMSGGAKDIASVAGEFPGAVRTPTTSDELFTKRVTPMAVTHPDAMAAHWFTRLWDPITMSGPYQKFMVDPRSQLSPEQQRLVRSMQGAQAANRDIPPAP